MCVTWQAKLHRRSQIVAESSLSARLSARLSGRHSGRSNGASPSSNRASPSWRIKRAVPTVREVNNFVRNLASHIRLHTIHRFRQVWLIVCHLFPRPSREQ